MKKLLIVYAHPCEESYSRALFDTACNAIASSGHRIDALDLYAENFQPVLTAQERRDYHDIGPNSEPVASYVERLRSADGLVLVFPVWNFGYPAILKGFIDRVFLPGISFVLKNGVISGNLRNIRSLVAVTTYGTTRFGALVCGDPPRKSVTRHIRAVVHPLANTKYLALYDMNRSTDKKRDKFREQVSKSLARL
ncbi:MAG: NAD(P)H-dependent oxidoreductase [Aestuariivita sp.]|nr:NAD(P)H-dependent oxidoreductase [Aestuariivita sp.]